MQRRHLLQAASAASVFPGLALADDKYPNKTINWICPYGAGGNADLRSRQLAKLMGEILGQSIIVETRRELAATLAPRLLPRPSRTATPSAWAISRH